MYSKISKIFENFDQNRDNSINRLKSNFLEIFEKIENFRKFWPKPILFENFTKIKIFLIFRKNRHFRKFWLKSKFFQNL